MRSARRQKQKSVQKQTWQFPHCREFFCVLNSQDGFAGQRMQSSDKTRGEWDIPGSENTGKGKQEEKKMALFQAFRAVRPAPEKAAQVAALPYDVVSREEAREIGENNPESFLHVDRAEMDLEPDIDLYDEGVYDQSKRKSSEHGKRGNPDPG